MKAKSHNGSTAAAPHATGYGPGSTNELDSLDDGVVTCALVTRLLALFLTDDELQDAGRVAALLHEANPALMLEECAVAAIDIGAMVRNSTITRMSPAYVRPSRQRRGQFTIHDLQEGRDRE